MKERGLHSRHTDGYVKQANIERCLGIDEAWVIPFGVRLLGEYVVELSSLDIGNGASMKSR